MNVLLAGVPEGPPDLLVAVVLLGVAFLVLQAPDVALSQITVGAVALPLMILLALAKVRRQPVDTEERPPEGDPAPEPRQEEA